MSKAVRYSANGAPEVLHVVEVDEPHAGPGQVRVSVRAAGLNPFDFKVRSIPGFLPDQTFPSGQGAEFAGVIDELGDDVTGAAVGDEVLGWTSFAAQAEFVVVPATHVAAKPAGLDWARAGGLGLVGNTAKRATDAVAPAPGDVVLVSGAAGGVGLFSAQLALRAGASVIGTASEANHDFLRGLGIVPIAYGDGMLDRLRTAAPHGVTAALDNVGVETVRAALALGAPAERINTVVHQGIEEYGIKGVGGGRKTAQELSELAELVASGAVVLPIAATYPLSEVRAAYEQLESRHLLGKIVLLLP